MTVVAQVSGYVDDIAHLTADNTDMLMHQKPLSFRSAKGLDGTQKKLAHGRDLACAPVEVREFGILETGKNFSLHNILKDAESLAGLSRRRARRCALTRA